MHVTPWFPPDKGGIASYVFNLSNELTAKGYNSSITTASRLKDRRQEQAKSKIKYIPSLYLPGWPYPTLKSVSMPLDIGHGLNSILKKGNFDLVHCHGIHYPLTWIAVYLAYRHGYRCIISLHGMFALNPNVLGGETKTEKWLYKHIFSRVMSKADTLITPAQSITNLANKYLKQTASSLLPTRVHTVEYGLDTARFTSKLGNKKEYRKIYGIDEKTKVLLFSGRFERVKGILEFCRATRKLVEDGQEGIEAIIVGEGSLGNEVRRVLGGIDGIHIFDWQPAEKIAELYVASDIMVIPSRFEGVPLTLLEAMNSGLYIVYSPVGGIPDMLEQYPSKTALMEVSDTEIYRALSAVISMNLGFPPMMSYAQQFDWTYIVDRIIKVYETIIK